MVIPCTWVNITAWIAPRSNGECGELYLQQEEDARREKALSALGLRIVRFRNDEVVRNLSAVAGRIKVLVLE